MDEVTIAYSRGTVALQQQSASALLDQLRGHEQAAGVAYTFESAAEAAAIVPPRSDVAVLVELLDEWAQRESVDGLPAGVGDLRCALHDELYDTSDEE